MLAFSTSTRDHLPPARKSSGIVGSPLSVALSDARLFIRDHRKLEDIPSERGRPHARGRGQEVPGPAAEPHPRKIESLKSEHTGKKKNLFAEMEKKLKEEIEKKSKPPI